MASNHPAKETLVAFGAGALSEERSAEVEQHLDVCPTCCETLLNSPNDTFIELVRRTRRLKENCPEIDFGSVGVALTVPSPSVAEMRAMGPPAGGADQATLLFHRDETVLSGELPPELIDHPRYRIVSLLGRGGMGNVYKAEYRLMNRPVAIKLINAQLVSRPLAVERFRREVQAAARLSHPNIVTAFDAEQAGSAHFLVDGVRRGNGPRERRFATGADGHR